MRIGIHADGGRAVGLGHLGRCAALAQAYRALGARVEFVDENAESRAWLAARGFRSVRAGAGRRDLIVADSYRLPPAGWQRLRRTARRSLFVDDLGRFRGESDWILNGHADAPLLRFAARPGASLLLGPAFVPLRREYWAPVRPRAVRPRIGRLLVTLGGGKGAAAAVRAALAAAAALPRAEITAVLASGAAVPSRAPANVAWRGPVASLRPLLEACDAVVCAGGQTLYEAACAGAPAVAARLAANQDGNLAGMSALGSAVLAGAPSAREFPRRLAAALKRLDASPALRRRMSDAGRAAVDGLGAARVARATLGRAA
jgi:spore coat polysaccharide biosynthesis predicted glycosyltransferase SpsG